MGIWEEAYNEGYKEGYEQGYKQGYKQGKQMVRVEIYSKLIIRFVSKKIGPMPESLKKGISQLDIKTLEMIINDIFYFQKYKEKVRIVK